MSKVPYILVVGDREAEEGTVNVNKRDVEEKSTVSIAEFIEKAVCENKNKQIF